MRKTRQRALKAAVIRLTGKPPAGVQMVESPAPGVIAYIPSLWRRVKKAHLASVRQGV